MARHVTRLARHCVTAALALTGVAACQGPATDQHWAAADSASFVPDDNRGFQLDVSLAATDTLLVHCAFYDQGAGGAEKRIILYREARRPSRFGISMGTHWAIAGECTAEAAENVATARGRVVLPPPIVLPVSRRAGERGTGSVLVVAWTKRRDGRWAQLERYSVLEQSEGTMYQFGDFRIACCLDAASAYVTHARRPESRSDRGATSRERWISARLVRRLSSTAGDRRAHRRFALARTASRVLHAGGRRGKGDEGDPPLLGHLEGDPVDDDEREKRVVPSLRALPAPRSELAEAASVVRPSWKGMSAALQDQGFSLRDKLSGSIPGVNAGMAVVNAAQKCFFSGEVAGQVAGYTAFSGRFVSAAAGARLAGLRHPKSRPAPF
ncbi:MAG: hypothetical protein HOQ09_07145 [Gemmatimonadaceae bacterium]|nr:hypothetical protein [Gemmatimonadaceae bacterium]